MVFDGLYIPVCGLGFDFFMKIKKNDELNCLFLLGKRTSAGRVIADARVDWCGLLWPDLTAQLCITHVTCAFHFTIFLFWFMEKNSKPEF